ncbi:MAG: histidine kinase [Chloroflexi bacterium]|nr:MAG: histidine kinase [Chloroflexota bacterium]HDN80100.1 GAF domain-containing protein [Chloroflexota bacterium]
MSGEGKELERLRRKVKELSSLVEVSTLIASRLDIEPLLQDIVEAATRLIGAELGGLLVLSQDGSRLYDYFKVCGWPFEPAGFPSGRGIYSLPYKTGQPLRVDRVRDHPQSVGFPPGHPFVEAFLGVPLKFKDKILGTLFLGNGPGGRTFTAEDEELLMAFATQASIAIENARLYAKARELARLQERNRIAQELHDTVAQLLFAIGIEADWCLERLPQDSHFYGKLQAIKRLAARATNEVRNAIFALSNAHKEGDLRKALREIVDEFEAMSTIKVGLVLPETIPPLTPRLEEAIRRVVRESLSNVHKHSRAQLVMISLTLDDTRIGVSIQDDGVGLSEESLTRFLKGDGLHFGITSMRRMVEELGGTLTIANNDDGGLMVKAFLPLPQEEVV